MAKSSKDILLEAAKRHEEATKGAQIEKNAHEEEQAGNTFIQNLLTEINRYMEEIRVTGVHWFFCIPDSACRGYMLPLFFCLSFCDMNCLVGQNGGVAPYALVQGALSKHCLRFHFPDKNTFECFIYENGRPTYGTKNIPVDELATPAGIRKWVDKYIHTAFPPYP